jgi:hypothetical protein
MSSLIGILKKDWKSFRCGNIEFLFQARPLAQSTDIRVQETPKTQFENASSLVMSFHRGG